MQKVNNVNIRKGLLTAIPAYIIIYLVGRQWCDGPQRGGSKMIDLAHMRSLAIELQGNGKTPEYCAKWWNRLCRQANRPELQIEPCRTFKSKLLKLDLN